MRKLILIVSTSLFLVASAVPAYAGVLSQAARFSAVFTLQRAPYIISGAPTPGGMFFMIVTSKQTAGETLPPGYNPQAEQQRNMREHPEWFH